MAKNKKKENNTHIPRSSYSVSASNHRRKESANHASRDATSPTCEKWRVPLTDPRLADLTVSGGRKLEADPPGLAEFVFRIRPHDNVSTESTAQPVLPNANSQNEQGGEGTVFKKQRKR